MTQLSSAERAAICRMILEGRAEEAFSRYRVSDLDQILLNRSADTAVRNATARDLPFKRYFKARIAKPANKIIATAFLINVVAVIGLCKIWPYYDTTDPETFTLASASASLLAVCAAAAGWGISGWLSYRNARVQHTINFISNRFTNDTFNKNLAAFNDRFTGEKIDLAFVDRLSTSSQGDDKLALQALRYVLNYFEFVSVGIICGDLDEGIVRRSLRGNLIFYTDRCMPYIRDVQKKNPRSLEHLITIRDHFRDI